MNTSSATEDRHMITDKELSECDREALHLIGHIQGQAGHVLFVAWPRHTILAADALITQVPWVSSSSGVAGSSPLGQTLEDWIPQDLLTEIDKIVADMKDAKSSRAFHFYNHDATTFSLSVSTTASDYSVIGLEVEELNDAAASQTFFQTVTHLGRVMEFYAHDIIVKAACDTVFQLLGIYDRGMVYRFLDDMSGQVIHEVRAEDLQSSYLGLRFPASDIPLPARQLYIQNGLRYINNVDFEAVPILSVDGRDLDLTQCRMRAVAKPHVVYLKNMGVTSSLSMAIVVDNELWGLLAFHGYRPGGGKPCLHQRIACETILRMVNVRIEALTRKLQSARVMRLGDYVMNLRQDQSVLHNLHDFGEGMLEVLDADTLVAHIIDPRTEDEDDSIFLGDKTLCPSDAFWKKMSLSPQRELVVMSTRAEVTARGLTEEECPACGVVFFQEGRLQVMFGRSLRSKDVFWGGDPDTPKLRIGGILHPRASFDTFMEKAKQEARAWNPQDLSVISVLRDRLCEHSHNWMMRLLQGDIEDTNRKYLNAINRARENYDFFARMSHELRTPFHGVMGCLSILRDSMDDLSMEEMKDLVATAISSGNHMINLLNDILDISKNKHLAHVEVKDRVIYQNLAHESVDGMKSLALSRGVRLVFQVDQKEEKLVIVTDRTKIIQIVSNVVSNAVKFADTSGVTVHVSLEDTIHGAVRKWLDDAERFAGCAFTMKDDQVFSDVETVRRMVAQIPSNPMKKWMCYAVSDGGCGITPNEVVAMFAPYTQSSSGSNRTFQGTGLGLFICVSLCQQLGGYIACASTPNEGTVFHFALPVEFMGCETGRPSSRSTSPSPEVPHITMTGPLMIVDDNQVNLKVLRRSLEMQFRNKGKDFEIITAEGGREGIALYKKARPSLCIVDYHMPEIDGVEVTQTIREYETDNDIHPAHILFYTADVTDKAGKVMVECGANEIMSKPPPKSFIEELVMRMEVLSI